MTADTRDNIIQNMLQKGELNIGIAPISKEHIQRVEQILLKKGILKQNEDPATRKSRTVKSLVKSWSNRFLKMEDRDWDEIKIKNITLT